MIPQALHIIDGFLSYVFEKCSISRVQAASEHEILPNENPHLVAKTIEIVTLVNAAAPDAQHIHVGVAHGLKQFAIFIFADAAGKAVGRDPVATFSEDRHAVYNKGEALAGLVGMLPEFQCTQASAPGCFIDEPALDQQTGFESIERMRA